MYTFFFCFQIFLFICKSDLWMQNLIGLLIIKDLHFYICLYYFYNWGFISVFVVVFLNILDNYMWLELSFFSIDVIVLFVLLCLVFLPSLPKNPRPTHPYSQNYLKRTLDDKSTTENKVDVMLTSTAVDCF